MSLFRTNTLGTRSVASASTTNAQDIQVVDGPPDSVSSLAWSPTADLLAAGSWDGGVRVWEVNAQGQSQGKAMYSHPGPVLSVCWNKAGTQVFSAGADNAVRMLDLQANPNEPQQVAAHDGPIKAVKWVETPQGPILVTGSWDKTLKYWDMRSPNPIATVQLAERCYALDVVYPLLVVGTAERHIHIINLTNPSVIYKTIESPLKWQTRSICCFPSADAFTIGSVEGRVAIHYVEEKDASKSYAFKCHRRDAVPNSKDGALVYPINHMTFHPVHGTLATCGSDGDVVVWDLNVRVRCKSYDIKSGPITAAAFSARGNLLAYACSYDWHKGHSGMTSDHPNKIMLHQVADADVQKRPPRR